MIQILSGDLDQGNKFDKRGESKKHNDNLGNNSIFDDKSLSSVNKHIRASSRSGVIMTSQSVQKKLKSLENYLVHENLTGSIGPIDFNNFKDLTES